MAEILFTNKFTEKIAVSTGGLGIYLRGFALIEDKKNYFENKTDDERKSISLADLKKNTYLYCDPNKSGDILDSCWSITYMPSLEYEGSSAIGVYEIAYNCALQYEIGKSIKDKNIIAIALIGQSVSEDKTYITPLFKSYLAGFIILNNDEQQLSDNKSFIFKINVGLSKESDLQLSLTQKFNYDATKCFDSDTSLLTDSFLIPAVKDTKYENVPNNVNKLNYFINLLTPRDSLNNIMSTKRPITMWCAKNTDIPLQLSVGGYDNSNKFISSEINFKISNNDIKINSKSKKETEQYNLFTKKLHIKNKKDYSISSNNTSGVNYSYFGINNSNLTTTPNGGGENNFIVNSDNINLYYYVNYDNVLNSYDINVANSRSATFISTRSIHNCDSNSFSGINFIGSKNISFDNNAFSMYNTLIGVDGLKHINPSDDTCIIENPETYNIDDKHAYATIIGKNKNSVLRNYNHNVMIGFNSLYANNKDKYIFGSCNSNFACDVCSGWGKIENPDHEIYGEDDIITCTACSGFGHRTPLFAIGNGYYSNNPLNGDYFNNYVNRDARDFNSELSKGGYRLNVFAAESNGIVENIHYRIGDKQFDKSPLDVYTSWSDFISIGRQEQNTLESNGYSYKPCYYTKDFIAFPKENHNEVYRIDYSQLYDLVCGIYDTKTSRKNIKLHTMYKGLKAERRTFFKGRKLFNLSLSDGMKKSNQFTVYDISNLVLKSYGKDLNNPHNFIDSSIPSIIYCHNYGKKPIYIKGSMWFKGMQSSDTLTNGFSVYRFSKRQKLDAGETIRLIYRKGSGNKLEGILNLDYGININNLI